MTIRCILTGNLLQESEINKFIQRRLCFLQPSFFFCIFASRMAKVDIKVQGLEQLQQRLLRMKEAVEIRLDMELRQLGEDAVTHAKENKGYHDRTANLKNSISYALYKDGEPVMQSIGQIPEPEATKEGQEQVEDNLTRFATKDGVVAPKGYTLIVVAGMNYGAAVESKGYNVLYLTGKWMHDKMKEILQEVLEDAKEL